MLELDTDKLRTIVENDFISNNKVEWHTDNNGDLLHIKIHNNISTLYICWADLAQAHYMILFDARKQRIYIKDITYSQEISHLITETFKNMTDIAYSTYRKCIKLSDDFERVKS